MPRKKAYISLALLIGICISLLLSAPSEAMAPKAAYHEAEFCQRQLHNSPHKMKYRDNWLRCIEKFQQVYRLDPDGPWAPAGPEIQGFAGCSRHARCARVCPGGDG